MNIMQVSFANLAVVGVGSGAGVPGGEAGAHCGILGEGGQRGDGWQVARLVLARWVLRLGW